MTTLCKICMSRDDDWGSDSLLEHVRLEHRDEPTSVEQVYPDLYDDVFNEDGALLETGTDTQFAAEGGESGPTAETTAPTDELMDTSYGKKWYLIGVGGAGNNLLDAVLLRRETLQEEHERRGQIWEGGLAGYGILNTNISELEGTYYAQEEQEYTRHDLLSNSTIGFGKHDYAGAGYRWDIGRELIAADFADGENPFRERWDMRPERIRDSQAVMFLHSVTKGTGCGATPGLAENIRTHVLEDDAIVPKPLFSSIVIPSKGTQYSEFGGRAKVNGVVGLARAARAVDAIIPFENKRLEEAQADIHPRINRLDEYNPPQYETVNKPLIAFLEAFTMSSVPQFLDREATMSIMGDVFDPADSFRPVEDKYEADPDREFSPAVILAPVLGRSRADSFDRSKLELLVRNALFQNKLAAFDPTTAWGGTFLVYGPEEKMDAVSDYVNDGTLSSIITGEEFLDAGETVGAETVDVHVKQLVTPYLDDVYLWGTLWNPKMPSLEEMYEHTAALKQEGNTEQARNVREVWEYVEALFSCLGRENMA